MKKAKKFLRENPTESRAVAAKIFNVNAKTLNAFIRRDSDMKNENVSSSQLVALDAQYASVLESDGE